MGSNYSEVWKEDVNYRRVRLVCKNALIAELEVVQDYPLWEKVMPLTTLALSFLDLKKYCQWCRSDPKMISSITRCCVCVQRHKRLVIASLKNIPFHYIQQYVNRTFTVYQMHIIVRWEALQKYVRRNKKEIPRVYPQYRIISFHIAYFVYNDIFYKKTSSAILIMRADDAFASIGPFGSFYLVECIIIHFNPPVKCHNTKYRRYWWVEVN